MMKFILGGLGNWYDDYPLTEKAVIEADKYDFNGAIFPDHYMWGELPWHKRPDSNKTLETWITISHLLAKTEKINIGTLVTPIPFRPPGILAKMISTADVLSGGRTIVGVGAGWSQIEFEGFSEWNSPKVRVDKTYEGLDLMIQLWTKEKVDFEGKYYQAKGAILDPKPLQKPYPKILFGSRGERMLKLAGQYANICFIPPWPGSNPEEMKQTVTEAARLHNRTQELEFMAGNMGPTDIGEYPTKIEEAVNSGAGYFLVSFQRSPNITDTIQKFAEEIIPSFR
ncbi:MAG: LLM class flavin-dependent oxidoreductase [Promethearchaeota archaeon]|jgi:alkanesulfonate monooxygenase SsuD/methylene tetrahydromethanopterin reductase-like flavin-dependent oxidoreductase (luciferase family)